MSPEPLLRFLTEGGVRKIEVHPLMLGHEAVLTWSDCRVAGTGATAEEAIGEALRVWEGERAR